jgi:hypothetical protein
MSSQADQEITRLLARIAELEAALVESSEELRLLIEHCGERELAMLRRIRAGLPPQARYAFEPAFWSETTDLTPAEVEPVLEELWRWTARRELFQDEC